MAIKSAFSGTGLSLVSYQQQALSGTWQATLTDLVSSWSHEIRALGGYYSASFTLNDTLTAVEDWLMDGLGRSIVVYDDAHCIIWEGFVNQITLGAGAIEVVRGPLLDICNRADIWYSTVDTSTTPPTVGIRKNIGLDNDTGSQAVYGILQSILSTGGCTEDNATQLRDMHLDYYAWPTTDTRMGSGSAPTVKVECVGWVRMLEKYAYNDTVSDGEGNLSTKMASILTADPNSLFTQSIATNTLQVPLYENDNAMAWDLLKGLTQLGDASFNRYLFGVYADRVAKYEAAPTAVEYLLALRDPAQAILSSAGASVRPWNVLPGKWLFFPDFLIGRVPEYTPLAEDPRAAFLESVTFNAPYGLSWNSAKVRRIDQRLAQLGLSGMGV